MGKGGRGYCGERDRWAQNAETGPPGKQLTDRPREREREKHRLEGERQTQWWGLGEAALGKGVGMRSLRDVSGSGT